jgi:hypothetical protein
MDIKYSKQALKNIKTIPNPMKERIKTGIDLLYALVLKFIPSDNPLPDEIEAIRQGEEDYKNGDIFSHEEVWK